MDGLVSLEEIERNTREFRKDIIQLDGGHLIKGKHLDYLNTIHYDIPNLEYNVLCELPRLLVRTSIFPRECRYINADQRPFLLWMAEVCNYYMSTHSELRDKSFWYLFGLLISSHIVDLSLHVSDLNYHLRRFITRFDIFRASYSFPFLEMCIRTKCKNFVNDDGLVIRGFNIPRHGRQDRSYIYGKYISNISDELKLLYFYVASSGFRDRLYKFLIELNEDSWLRFPDPFELIGYWRNRLLHGEQMFSSGGDIATYLICLILLSYITPEKYNSKLHDLKKDIQYKQKTSSSYLWYTYKI